MKGQGERIYSQSPENMSMSPFLTLKRVLLSFGVLKVEFRISGLRYVCHSLYLGRSWL